MTQGIHFDPRDRDLIVHFRVNLLKSPIEIYNELFYGRNVTLQRIQTLCSHIDREYEIFGHNELYLVGSQHHGGRPKALDAFHRNFLANMLQSGQYSTVKDIYADFVATLYPPPHNNHLSPSYTTIYRAIHELNYTNKVVERRNIQQNPVERFNYLNKIKYIHPLNLIDVDETACSPDHFKEKYGWAPIGDKCMKMQIQIGNRHFTTVAAYSCSGFIKWKIFEHGYTHGDFIQFLNELQPLIVPGNCLIVDNAAVHKTVDALHTLNVVSGSMYVFSPVYSPDLKPIERGFANIKRWIRKRENSAMRDPIGYINRAFELYSVTGTRGYVGKCFV